jgi:hypothetical protein
MSVGGNPRKQCRAFGCSSRRTVGERPIYSSFIAAVGQFLTDGFFEQAHLRCRVDRCEFAGNLVPILLADLSVAHVRLGNQLQCDDTRLFRTGGVWIGVRASCRAICKKRAHR